MDFERETTGVITEVKTVWWIKVKLKPVRTHSLDGVAFPHTVAVEYTVNGRKYVTKVYIPWRIVPPQKGTEVTVLYNDERPKLCMIRFN